MSQDSATDNAASDSQSNANRTEDSACGSDRESALNRSMGLWAALAIGVGTMVGAGIFVFPGLVAEAQGASGIFAFLLAGSLALVVAFYTAELATALPLSGGSYTIIEEFLGSWPGRIVGLAQWAGLLFASAFYLSAFSDYAADIALRLGWDVQAQMHHAGPVAALMLTGVIILGGRGAGSLQTGIVLLLTLALTVIFLFGLGQVTLGDENRPDFQTFIPEAPLSLVTTAAMIFTAYIGFVQIAAVGGEVKHPGRNLPASLVGSVLIVLLLYLLVYFVSTVILGPAALADAGETAVVEAGRAIAGVVGLITVLGAGLLATLSSANASTLSASRTLFALARDGFVPRVLRRTGFGGSSPWVAVLLTGLPSAALAYFSPGLLAEVASLLHLLIYGLICIAIWPARRGGQEGFDPAFRVWGHPALAVVAGIACFALVGFMSTGAQLASLAVLAGSFLFLVIYQRAAN